MELAQLIEALSSSAAYPQPVESVEVRQTNNSVVFLAGAFASVPDSADEAARWVHDAALNHFGLSYGPKIKRR